MVYKVELLEFSLSHNTQPSGRLHCLLAAFDIELLIDVVEVGEKTIRLLLTLCLQFSAHALCTMPLALYAPCTMHHALCAMLY
jgi:hypothetical protein